MSIPIIRRELESRLLAWAQTQNPVPQIAFQNQAFTPPAQTANVIWLECRLIPNLVSSRDVTATKETFKGLFQINVWSPSNAGMGRVESVAESIKASFPVVPKVGGVSIDSPPKIAAPIDSNGWVATPIVISYRYES